MVKTVSDVQKTECSLFIINVHVYQKLKIAPTPYCQCGQVEQTVSHILHSAAVKEGKSQENFRSE